MDSPDHVTRLLQSVTNSLTAGFAIADEIDGQIEYTNPRFDEWFPAASGDLSLAGRLAGLTVDRARKRLDKGRPYVFESELRSGARTTALRTTLRAIELDGRPAVLAETIEITKQKEQEHMLDSFSHLAERNKKELEKANEALTRKTEELKEAFDVIKAQRDRMERELKVARQVQMNMLPRALTPNSAECTVAGTLKPALEVGGDFFDFFYVDNQRLCFLVGDVADKGAASGLFMAAAKTLIKAYAVGAESTAEIIQRVNSELSINNESCMFVTLFLAVLDLKTGHVELTNAGHNPPYRIRHGQVPELIQDRNGPAVGIVEDAKYTTGRFVLEPSDLVVVYSDGITEAMNRERELFGEGRLETILKSKDATTAESAVRSIAKAVEEFEEGSKQSDDVTVIAVQFHGA